MRQIRSIALFSLLGMLLSTVAFPGTSIARVFRVFGPETFTRSTKGPATEVRQFLVQYPRVYDFTLHIFYKGLKKGRAGRAPSAVVTLNGEQVATPEDFNRNIGYTKKSIFHNYLRPSLRYYFTGLRYYFNRNRIIGYIKKPITLSDLNSLSVELRDPGSEMRIVITARNNEPLSFDVQDIIHPDGSNLFGPDLSYLWTVVNKPDGANVTLELTRDPSSPELIVNLPGEYTLKLVISGGFWKSEPIPIKLLATEANPEYPDYIPVPVKTRVVTGAGDQYGDYSIQVGNTIYPAPVPTACGSPSNSGFQVLVLDRATLAKKDHRSFNVPCGSSNMEDFLDGLDNTSLVILSSLNNARPMDVCQYLPFCPLGTKLMEFGATTIFNANFTSPLTYNLTDGTPVEFSYSLIGIKGLGQYQGTELNNWDHRANGQDTADWQRISSNIEGSFVKDSNPGITSNWTFIYPEFIEIQTHTATSTTGNTIKVGSVSYGSTTLKAGAAGGFQAIQLYGDTLGPLSDPQLDMETYSTNCGTGTGSVSESEQKRMYDDLVDNWATGNRYVGVFSTVGAPISYKSVYFADLIKAIGNSWGGTIGVLNGLDGATSSYSLVGMTIPYCTYYCIPLTYPLGSADTVDAMSSTIDEHNLRVVMHKNKQGWFKPVIKYTEPYGDTTGHSDFSLVSVALQPSVPWPLPDPGFPTTDSTYQEQLRAYQYISGHVGAGSGETDIRSQYVGADNDAVVTWGSTCSGLDYDQILTPTFSRQVFYDMKKQICGVHDENNDIYGEIDYVREVNAFNDDMNIALLNMQINSSTGMDAVYQMVRDTVPVPDSSRVLYDAGMVVRGILTGAGSIVTNAAIKGTMGVINGALTIAMNFSKKPEGPDYTTIDTAYSSLQTEMNELWGSCTTGTHKLVSMIKKDWGKLQYVGIKFMLPHDTPPENGGPGWQYDHQNDPDSWNSVVTNSLQAYYLQSIMPAVWHIDNMLDSTNINNPWNFGYTKSDQWNTKYYCTPYCMDISSNANAYQVDSFSSGSSWYVLTSNDMFDDEYCKPCACVRYEHSATLRDILFGQGYWDAGQKLQLDKRVFYERWLPSSVYRLPLEGDLGDNYYSTSSCVYWGP